VSANIWTDVKRLLARAASAQAASGATLLIYHRVGGGSETRWRLGSPVPFRQTPGGAREGGSFAS
jgi:hypothetical protein